MAHAQPQAPNGKYTKLLTGILTALIIVMIGELVWKNKKAEEEKVEYRSVAPAPAPMVNAPAPTSNATYKDGTYTATGHYESPGGADTIGVKLTIKDGVVTNVTITPNNEGISEKYQENFAKNVKSVVIGQKISDIKLDNVSGSSLTPIGFNDALDQIKTQAQI